MPCDSSRARALLERVPSKVRLRVQPLRRLRQAPSQPELRPVLSSAVALATGSQLC